ncbi:MAG: LacI family DNA-binding transcriptional regulator [Oscillospiraceae bacterium]|nr:LacI family DNA-binding transcriptional regulator [Oscillospiraceae bacterium]
MPNKGTQRVTMKEIARETGFSVNTVSKALRDAPDLSGQTKRMIRDVAKRLGYVANNMASALRSGYSSVLALIVGDISNPFFGILCKEIEQQAARHNYTVIVFNTEEDPEKEDRAVRTALSQNVDGVLLAPSQNGAQAVRLLQAYGKPCVLIGRYFADRAADAVLYDDENGGYLAGKHLLECGCRNLLMINAPHNSSAENRAKGFARAMTEVPGAKSRMLTVESPLGGVPSALRQAYEQETIDGIFAYSDLFAMKAIWTLDEMGVEPGTVRIVGFDDIQSRLSLSMPLTTIGAGKAAFGQALVELLMKRISGDMSDFPVQQVLPTKLVVRKSTRQES